MENTKARQIASLMVQYAEMIELKQNLSRGGMYFIALHTEQSHSGTPKYKFGHRKEAYLKMIEDDIIKAEERLKALGIDVESLTEKA